MSRKLIHNYHTHRAKMQQVNADPVLTKREKKSLAQLGETLGVTNLVDIFTACAKASTTFDFDNDVTPQRVAILINSGEKTVDVLEEMTAHGHIVPAFGGVKRHLKLTLHFHRHQPDAPEGALFSAGFTQARFLSDHAERDTNPDKMVCWFFSSNEPGDAPALPDARLPQGEKLVDVLKDGFLKDLSVYMLGRDAAPRQLNP